ncbi:N,N-dimethylformamidase beta subunit family domain-containing protein [Mastigocoleus sp. MO_188.B34]|uniref:N,N-dimethylformamidase beta subunit family domain-containing protein n=1 Tax=Mastigocoleus sp. MO_188.B34 TaxID=3036635 RepID=UPI00261F082A|nr:N,N-dimethylformamidase beta subunit family domain-containing protein [Mastigocoleus sp. MO_188.B34]MDJ0693760.1 hypothetical protein [Mastigocoleus sp. MO_188.B34]
MFTIKKLRYIINPFMGLLVILISFGLIFLDLNWANNKPKVTLPNNPIIIENQKIGSDNWHLTNPATNHEIEGYASLTSVNRASQIELFVNTQDPAYTIEIFRMGWYGGKGARQVTPTITRKGIEQPAPIVDRATGLIECDWLQPYILHIPENPQESTEWTSGVYLAKLTGSKTGKQSYINFVVRDDKRSSDILFQTSVTTYQAYNNWGGMSLYRWNSKGKQATKVSFNRPYATSPNEAAAYGVGAGEFLTNFQPQRRTSNAAWEYNMVRWLERSGYDVSYCTDIDTHENHRVVREGKRILSMHKAFFSVGHDEYWSWQMRHNIEVAKDKGLSLGFFSANTCYWQIRFEPSKITKDINRTIVSYKEGAALDPFTRDNNLDNDYLITTRWRNQPLNRPEDALIGVMYETFQVNADIIINQNAPEWAIANTQLKPNNLQISQKELHTQHSQENQLPQKIKLKGLLGYEVDRMFGNAPADTVVIAHSPYTYKGNTRYADMTVYQAESGATVFATGSMQWSWGLDDYNAPNLRPSLINLDAQQITRNAIERMID